MRIRKKKLFKTRGTEGFPYCFSLGIPYPNTGSPQQLHGKAQHSKRSGTAGLSHFILWGKARLSSLSFVKSQKKTFDLILNL